MARQTGITTLSGTIGDVTFVQTKNGPYARARRGLYTPIEVNKSFKRSSKDQSKANRHAKMFKDAIEPFRYDLIDTSMWARLLGIFRKNLLWAEKKNYSSLNGFRIHEEHPLPAGYWTEKKVNTKHVHFSISIFIDRRKSANANGYQLEIFALTITSKKKPHVIVTPFLVSDFSKDRSLTHEARLKISPTVKSMIIVAKMHFMHNGEFIINQKQRGMEVVDVVVF